MEILRREGGGLHNAPDLVLLTSDTGSQPQTSEASLDALHSATTTEDPEHDGGLNTPMEWLEPLPYVEDTHRRRHTDVSQDPRYTNQGLAASDGDTDGTEIPNRVPTWVLPTKQTQALFEKGLGTAPDIIYAKGVPFIPNLGQITVNKKLCILILVEVGLCRDLGYDSKHTKKTKKYSRSSRLSRNIEEE